MRLEHSHRSQPTKCIIDITIVKSNPHALYLPLHLVITRLTSP